MPTRTISTKLAIEGESQYRQALQSINSTYSQLGSQLKLVKSEFQNQQNTLAALQAKEKALADIQSALSQKVQTCKEAYSNAQSAMSTYKAKIDDLKGALEKNKTALDGMDSATKKSGQQWLSYKTHIDEAEAKLKVLASTSGDTSAEEEKLRREIEQAQAAMDKLDAETGGAAKTAGELLQQQQRLNTELGNAEAGYSACERACDGWKKKETDAQIALNDVNAELELNEKYLKEAETASDGCAKSIDEFGNKTDKAGDAATALYGVLAGAGMVRAVKELAEAFIEVVNAAAEFEAQMSTVKAISGATGTEMLELSSLAKEMGATTKFTATEAGQGLEYMAMAGWRTQDMLDGLEGIMDLAAAAGENLATTSDIVTDALTAFGLSAKDSAHFSDVLAQASANSNTNVTMMGESFKMVATTAGSMGYSIDDVAVALGAMANQGLKSEMAGTALATALTRMSGTNEKAKETMDRLNLSMFDGEGNAKDLSTFLDELRTAFSGMNDQQQLSNAYMLAGQKGMKGLMAIVNTSETDWNKLTDAIAGSSGAAKLMAETKLDNYAGQVTLLKSAFSALETEIGSVFTPVLTEMAEKATNAFTWMADVVHDHPVLVAAIAGVVTALGALVAVVIGITLTQTPMFVKALGTLATAFKGLYAVITAHPFGAIATAIAAVVVGIGTAVAAAKAHAEAQMVETNAAKSLIDVLDEQAKTYEELQTTNKEAATNTSALANSVIELSKTAASSQLDHAALLETIDQLNEAVPELNLAYDEETGSLNQTTDAILGQVEAQNQLNEADAEIARYNELRQDREAIELKIKEATDAVTEAQTKLNESEDLSRAEKKELRREIEDNNGALEIYNEQLATVNSQIEEMRPHAEALIESMNGTAGMCEQAAALADSLATSLLELRTAYDEAYDSALDSIQGQAEAWDTLDEVVAMSSEDITTALESQIAYWESYTENIDNLTGRNIEGIDRLVAAYDGNAAAIAGLASMSDEQIRATIARLDALGSAEDAAAQHTAEAVTGYSDNAMQLIENCKATLADPANSEAMMQAALEMLQGFAMGIDQSGEEVDEATQRAAQEVIDTWKTVHDSHSPSKVFEQIGKDDMTGYINGVNGEDGNTQSALQALAQRAIAAFKGIANGSTLTGSGSQTISGYMSGVNSQSGNATSTLQRLAQSATSAFKGISNNSALQGSGSDTISGYVSGVNGQTSSMTNKMRSMAQSAINAMNNNATSSSLYSAGLNTIQGFINGVANKASSLYSTLASMASNALARFKSVLGIHSPSTEFASAGQFTVAGFVDGVKRRQADVQDTMAAMAKKASVAFKAGLNSDLDIESMDYMMASNSAGIRRNAAALSEGNSGGVSELLAAIHSVGQKMDNLESSDGQKIELPIYINGTFTKREIVEIARAGIGRQMVNINAAHGGN